MRPTHFSPSPLPRLRPFHGLKAVAPLPNWLIHEQVAGPCHVAGGTSDDPTG